MTRPPTPRRTGAAAALLTLVVLTGAAPRSAVHGGAVELDERERAAVLRLSPLPQPPLDPTNRVDGDARAEQLGRRIFFSPRFSRDGTVSCSTCHVPEQGFADGAPTPPDFDVQRNTPGLWNLAHQRWYFWDGRADRLWSQALEPLENPREHGGSRLFYVHLVHGDDGLRAAYEQVFGALPDLSDGARFPAEGRPVPDQPGHAQARAWSSMAEADRAAVDEVFANLGKSVAAYLRGIQSRRSPFDVFVEGLREDDASKQAVLSDAARRGLRLFLGRGQCTLCHSGPLLSDREFHDLRLPAPPGVEEPGRHGGVARALANPFNGMGRHSDDPDAGRERLVYLDRVPELWGQFKTPSLRNVARTAPYMHRGQLATLRDVLHYYATLDGARPAGHHAEVLLRPRGFSETEVEDLIAFLEALTDEQLPPELRTPPQSP